MYGGLHLIAWSPSHFPTSIETWLWRASGLVMIAAPALFVVVVGVFEVNGSLADLLRPLKPAPKPRSEPRGPGSRDAGRDSEKDVNVYVDDDEAALQSKKGIRGWIWSVCASLAGTITVVLATIAGSTSGLCWFAYPASTLR